MDDAVLGARVVDPRRAARRRVRRRMFGLAALAMLLVLPLLPGLPISPATAAVTEPTVTAMPAKFRADFINNDGVVAGLDSNGGFLPATWDGTTVTVRQAPLGFYAIYGFNDAGLMLGTNSAQEPSVWTASSQANLVKPTIGSGRYFGGVYGPGTNGQVTATINPWKPSEANAAFWATPNSAASLITSISTIEAMAPNGDVVGMLSGSVTKYARATPSGTVTNLTNFPNSYIIDISPNGTILGSYWNGGSFLYRNGAVTTLPPAFQPRAINGLGVVVGTQNTPTGQLAAIRQTNGDIVTIDSQVGPQTIVDSIFSATDINDDCSIIATGLKKVDTSYKQVQVLVQLPGCANPLDITFTELPDDTVRVGDEFTVTAKITNTSPTGTLTGFSLPDGGLSASEGVEAVSGPTWTPVSSLPPGGSVEVSWVLTSAHVGSQTIQVQAAAVDNGTDISKTGKTFVPVAPPVDVVVETGQGSSTEVGDEFDVGVTVKNEWDQPVADIKPGAIDGSAAGSIAKVTGPLGPDGEDATSGGYDLDPGESVRFTYTFTLQQDLFPQEITAHLTGRDPETNTVFFISGHSVPPKGLVVGIDTERDGTTLHVTTKVHNDSGGPVDDLGRSGVINEPIDDGEGGVAPSPLGEGERISELPETLAVGETAEAITDYEIVGLGLAVLSETVNGLNAGDDVGGEDIVSIVVDQGEVTRADAEQAAVDGFQDAIGALSAEDKQIMESFTEEVAAAADRPVNDPEVQRTIDAFRNIGFDPEMAENMAVWSLGVTSFPDRADAMWDGFKDQVGVRGVEAKTTLAAVLTTLRDPVKREALTWAIYNGSVENLGYMADVSQMKGPELLATAIPANKKLAGELAQDLQFAWDGQKQLGEIERQEFLADPAAANRKGGLREGGYLGNGVVDAAIGITGEGASAAGKSLLGALGRAFLGEGLEAGMSSSRVAATGADAADPLSDTTSQLTRLEEAERNSLNNVPKGTVLALDETFAAATGMAPLDAEFFQDCVQQIEDKYHIKFMASFRTAEASSIDIENVLGKEEWNAFKAVGAMDEAIGAPASLRGQASVFPAEAMTKDAIDGLESQNAGFTKRYQERLTLQEDNWRSYQAGTSKMNKIVDGSLAHAESGGIRIINDRPGRSTHGVTYIEQLDEPEFLASKGLTPESATVLRDELLQHPGLTQKINVVAEARDGGVAFGVKNALGDIFAIGSDFDLQYFGPTDGVWPAGKKGQIITEFMQLVGKNPRVPVHGASDLGFDMSAGSIAKLAEFEMLPYNAAAAGPKAEQVLKRMQQVAGDLRRQADKLEFAAVTTVDPVRAQVLLKEVDDIRKNADKIAAITKDQLIKYAKGEKLVTITKGDIRVGGDYP